MNGSHLLVVYAFLLCGCAQRLAEPIRPFATIAWTKVVRLEILTSRDAQPYELVRDARGDWYARAPIRDRVSSDVIGALARACQALTLDVRAGGAASAERKHEPPLAYVRAGDGERDVGLELFAAGPEPETLWAASGQHVGLVPAAFLASLQLEQEALRDRRLSRLADATRVRLVRGSTSAGPAAAEIVGSKAGWTWRSAEHPAVPADQAAQQVLGLEASSFVYGGGRALGPAPARIEVQAGDAPPSPIDLRPAPSGERAWLATQPHRDVDALVVLPPEIDRWLR